MLQTPPPPAFPPPSAWVLTVADPLPLPPGPLQASALRLPERRLLSLPPMPKGPSAAREVLDGLLFLTLANLAAHTGGRVNQDPPGTLPGSPSPTTGHSR